MSVETPRFLIRRTKSFKTDQAHDPTDFGETRRPVV